MSLLVSCRHGIACRLYAIVGLALAAVLILAVASIYFASISRRSAETLHTRSLVSVFEATEIELLLERHRRIVEAVPFNSEPSHLQRDRNETDALLARMDELATRADNSDIDNIVGPDLIRLSSQAREIFANAALLTDTDSDISTAQYTATSDRIRNQIRKYREARIDLADKETKALSNKSKTLVTWVLVLAIAAIVLIGPLSLFLIRAVAVRLKDITHAMTRLAENDTSVILEVSSGRCDEINEMAKAVDVFRSNAMTLLEQKVRLEQLYLWLDVALNNMARGLSMFDAEQRLLVSNAAYARMYDLPPELIRPGTPFRDIIEHRKDKVEKLADLVVDPEQVDSAERARAIASVSAETRTSLTMKTGKIFEVSIRPLVSGGWVALHEDVTERRLAADQVVRLAKHDTLTGLANRHQFREKLEALSAALENGEPFVVHCIDLDRFKEVNDTLGHPAGDALLKAVADRLRSIVRSNDLVARLGGDEFAVIQPAAGNHNAAESLANRIISSIKAPYQILGQRVEIGATVGLALAPMDGSDPDEILKKADMALYRAKGDGRGRVSFYDPQMEGILKARRLVELDLHCAIEEQQFELHYQPILDLARNRVAGCEALIRWKHPQRGMISPAQFIPVAESIGLIPVIGEWAIRTACEAAAKWPEDVKVAVNLSPAQFGASDIVKITAEALAMSGLPSSRLELEVTESLILDDKPETVDVLHRLRGLGVRTSLDDFGTGYSSLSYLRRFPFDKIKIDQSFVRDLSKRQDCVAIVGAVAQLARSLAMTTVAEGVETGDHLTRVQAAGCNEAQGYLFSRPVPNDKIVAVIQSCNQQISQFAAVA